MTDLFKSDLRSLHPARLITVFVALIVLASVVDLIQAQNTQAKQVEDLDHEVKPDDSAGVLEKREEHASHLLEPRGAGHPRGLLELGVDLDDVPDGDARGDRDEHEHRADDDDPQRPVEVQEREEVPSPDERKEDAPAEDDPGNGHRRQ